DPAETVVLRASRSPLGEPPHPEHCATSYTADPTFVVTIPQGRAWADHFTSAVFTDRGELVTELSLGSAELIALSEHLPPPRRVAGTVALLSVAGGSMFCHWLLNLLSRIRLLADAGWTLDQIDWVAVNEQEYAYQTETLALLGIPRHKLIVSNPDDRHIIADRLVVPSRVDRATPWMCDTLRQLFLRPDILQSIAPCDRLYISRDLAKYRRVIEDQQLSDWLVREQGFKIVLLETLSFAKQVALLAQAKVIVAPHGAGLTNLVFCQPGTIVVELFSPRYVPSYFWEIADLIGLQHYHLVGEPLANHPDPQAIEGYQFSDPGADGIWIPFDRFKRAINALLNPS
ncbi:MAG TPA: glycosyltransferase family 61 protein, partial [Coleofasciculaceae cyanobacterium]